MNTAKKAIVIGASSGIGRALAKVLAENGYTVGLAARRIELLQQLKEEIPSPTYIKQMDLRKPDEARGLLEQLIAEMQGADLLVLNSGINPFNLELEWEKEKETLAVNIAGFAAMANVAVKHFLAQKSGHLVGISSIAGLRGSANCCAYNSSKAFVSNYLEGLRYRLEAENIYVTDIRPGLVDTAMIRGKPGLFWVATAEAAARQIYRAIRAKKKVAYITRRWVLIAWLMRCIPDWLWCKLYRRSRPLLALYDSSKQQ